MSFSFGFLRGELELRHSWLYLHISWDRLHTGVMGESIYQKTLRDAKVYNIISSNTNNKSAFDECSTLNPRHILYCTNAMLVYI